MSMIPWRNRLSLISMSAGALNYRREEIPAELAEQISPPSRGTRAAGSGRAPVRDR